jgi:hypothetical protein
MSIADLPFFQPPPLFPVERFSQRDLEMAANDIILAMDGKMRRDDALMCARAVFEGLGMVRAAHPRARSEPPQATEGEGR